jgi:hypothetical protein
MSDLTHTQGAWKVRERRKADGSLIDCFVEAPKENDMAYGLEVLGDDYTGYGDVERKYEDCRRVVACVNACRGLDTDNLEKTGLVSAVGYELRDLDAKVSKLSEALRKLQAMQMAGQEEIIVAALGAA